MRVAIILIVAIAAGWLSPADASPAPRPGCSNADALGTSRTLVVDPAEHTRLGVMQYGETLPLNDREVVLTFDDGPLPPYSNRVLDILAAECVKATFFLVGRMAMSFPNVVARIHREGHSIGTHSQSHPLGFHKITLDHAEREIEVGIASIKAALGGEKALAPFFRIPGLRRTQAVEQYLASRGLMTWSADFPADDWKHISSREVTRRAMQRLEVYGRGMLLLHDIQPATVLALPTLLRELKARGFRIVHVVPATPQRVKTATLPYQWRWRTAGRAQPVAALDVGSIGAIPGLPVTTRHTAHDNPLASRLLLPIAGGRKADQTTRHGRRAEGRLWRKRSIAPRWRDAALPAPDRGVFALPQRPAVWDRPSGDSAEPAVTGSVAPWPDPAVLPSSGLSPALFSQLRGER